MRGIEQVPWLYDPFMGLLERTGLGRWRAWLCRGARGRTLDLGCGTGRNLPLFPPETRVAALDPCHESLLEARRRAPGAWLVRGRAEMLPFRAGVFDTVVCGLVLCSVADPRLGLTETQRVLKPEGRLRILEHVRARRRWHARLQDLGQPFWTWLTGGCHPNRETEATVEACGFVIEAESRRARGLMTRLAARPPARLPPVPR